MEELEEMQKKKLDFLKLYQHKESYSFLPENIISLLQLWEKDKFIASNYKTNQYDVIEDNEGEDKFN